MFERACEVGIQHYAETMKPKKRKVSAASRGDPAGPVVTSGSVFSSDREALAVCHPHGHAGARGGAGLRSG